MIRTSNWALSAILFSLLFTLAAGCGVTEANLAAECGDACSDAGDNDSSSDTDVNDGDADNDGYNRFDSVGRVVDCNDDDPDVHPGATEIDNGVDDDCDGEVDEGFEDDNVPGDGDGDGFPANPDDIEETVYDCDDTDDQIYPGAPEVCGDDVDNDCDGEVDENCSDDDGDVIVTADFPDNSQLALAVQVYYDESDLGEWWEDGPGEWDVANDEAAQVTLSGSNFEFDNACGLRLNVTVGSPGYDWLCYGNTYQGSAVIRPYAEVTVNWRGTTYDESDFVTWSPGNNPSLGCSAVLVVVNDQACQVIQ